MLDGFPVHGSNNLPNLHLCSTRNLGCKSLFSIHVEENPKNKYPPVIKHDNFSAPPFSLIRVSQRSENLPSVSDCHAIMPSPGMIPQDPHPQDPSPEDTFFALPLIPVRRWVAARCMR